MPLIDQSRCRVWICFLHHEDRLCISRMPLHSLGSNSSFQLSHPHNTDLPAPAPIPQQLSPLVLSSGGNPSLLLTPPHKLFRPGLNSHGQCFLPTSTTLVRGFERAGIWKNCASTWEGSICFDLDGLLYTFGKIKGIDENLRAKDVGREKKVVSGVQHFVVFDENEGIGFGDSRKGQVIGNGRKFPEQGIGYVTCGKDMTCILSRSHGITIYTNNKRHEISSIPSIVKENMNDIKAIVSSWSTIIVF